MDKITVKVCLGTTCFVMGGSELQDMAELLPKDWREYVDFAPQTCLDKCKNFKEMKPPFVYVGDELVTEATVKKVFDVVETKIKLIKSGETNEK